MLTMLKWSLFWCIIFLWLLIILSPLYSNQWKITMQKRSLSARITVMKRDMLWNVCHRAPKQWNELGMIKDKQAVAQTFRILMVVKTYFAAVSLPASMRKNPLKIRWIGNYSTARSKESKQAEINWQLFRIHASGIRHAVSRFLFSEKIWTLRWTGGRHKKKRERKKYTGQTWIENTGKSTLIDCLHCCSLCSVKSVQVWRVSERFLQTI